MSDPLFESARLRLAPPDADKDAETESKWTHDPDYLRALSPDPAKPLSVPQIKKRHEAEAKEQGNKLFRFALRTLAEDKLIGFTRLHRIEWNNGVAWLELGLAEPDCRGQGYGTEALRLIVNYAFNELNLYRLNLALPGYNAAAQRFLERAGFTVEVRRREAIHRDGQRWDLLWLGLLRDEWKK